MARSKMVCVSPRVRDVIHTVPIGIFAITVLGGLLLMFIGKDESSRIFFLLPPTTVIALVAVLRSGCYLGGGSTMDAAGRAKDATTCMDQRDNDHAR